MKPRLIYVCDANLGGIYEYARCQAVALAAARVAVSFLCRADYPGEPVEGCQMERRLPAKSAVGRARMVRALEVVRSERRAAREVARMQRQGRGEQVLGACYREYFAPLWAGAFRRARKAGMNFATVAHDPVRDFVLGPVWWHRWSVSQGYSFVSHAFAHDDTALDTGRPMPGLRVTVIPHGPISLPPARRERETMRAGLGLAGTDRLFLAFGHLRDAKNLSLFIQAMKQLPAQVRLVVAGKESSETQQSVGYYQALAAQLGVAERCHWIPRYIPGEEAADLFAAADYCLLTYNHHFRSASGVLNTATTYRRAVLASSGAGPLAAAVQHHHLGEWVEPDSVEAIVAGVERLLAGTPMPDWEGYAALNSWERNAAIVRAALFGAPAEVL
jgi:glycosyltransferase involved in cell wall biosynthesis